MWYDRKNVNEQPPTVGVELLLFSTYISRFSAATALIVYPHEDQVFQCVCVCVIRSEFHLIEYILNDVGCLHISIEYKVQKVLRK